MALLALALLASACGGSTQDAAGGDAGEAGGDAASDEPVHVAAIFTGQLEGNAYNEVHYEALQEAVEAVGGEDRIQFQAVFDVPYTERATQTVQQLFTQGADMVVDTLGAATLFTDACEEFPDRKCVTSSMMPGPNVRVFRPDDALVYYVEGVAAGHVTETGVLGFVSPFKQPYQIAYVNAFALGCQSVRSDCIVRNVYVNSFFDPPKSTEAANSLIDAGADVMNHRVNDPSPLVAARDRGKMGFGLYQDQTSRAPEAWITGRLTKDGLTKIFERELQDVLDGTWEGNTFNWGQGDTPNLPLAPWGDNVPQEAQDAASEVLERMADGFNPFTGPIADESGTIRLEEGESLDPRSPEVYTEWDWPVEGTVGLS